MALVSVASPPDTAGNPESRTEIVSVTGLVERTVLVTMTTGPPVTGVDDALTKTEAPARVVLKPTVPAAAFESPGCPSVNVTALDPF
jgi:hypothetical protein